MEKQSAFLFILVILSVILAAGCVSSSSGTTAVTPYVTATLNATELQKGMALVVSGNAGGGIQNVYVSLYSADGTTYPTKLYTVPVQSDGSFSLKLDTSAFPKSQYGVTASLPGGESTTLSFLIE